MVTYDRILSDVKKPNFILEIGVQNGGSLEIWSELFPKAKRIIGVDIDPMCSELKFASESITVISGDAKANETHKKILSITRTLDFVVDDGSHTSEDIVANLIKYLPMLNPGGVYVIEDLHASYWSSYGGSLFGSETSLSFLKRIVDVVNIKYWNQKFTIQEALEFGNLVLTNEFLNSTLEIREIRFFDSLAVIYLHEKFGEKKEQTRVSSGSEAQVNKDPKELVGRSLQIPLEKPLEMLDHGRLTSNQYLEMRSRLFELETTLSRVTMSRSWRWTALIRRITSTFDRT